MRRREGASAAGTVSVVDDLVAACLGASQRIPTLPVRPSARAQVYAERRVGNGGHPGDERRSQVAHTTLSLAAMAAVLCAASHYGRPGKSQISLKCLHARSRFLVFQMRARGPSVLSVSPTVGSRMTEHFQHFGYSTGPSETHDCSIFTRALSRAPPRRCNTCTYRTTWTWHETR